MWAELTPEAIATVGINPNRDGRLNPTTPLWQLGTPVTVAACFPRSLKDAMVLCSGGDDDGVDAHGGDADGADGAVKLSWRM